MRDALLYILLSMIDGISIFIFSFGSFKVNLKSYWKEIALTVTIISTGNYFLSQHDNLSNYTPIICIILLFASLLFYFRISVFSSIRLTILGFVTQSVIQLGLVAITTLLFNTSMGYIQENTKFSGSLQILSGIIMIGGSLLLRKKRWYFTTMPYDYSYKINFSKLNIIFLTLSFLIIVVFANIDKISMSVELVFWILCLINVLVLESKKQMRNEID